MSKPLITTQIPIVKLEDIIIERVDINFITIINTRMFCNFIFRINNKKKKVRVTLGYGFSRSNLIRSFLEGGVYSDNICSSYIIRRIDGCIKECNDGENNMLNKAITKYNKKIHSEIKNIGKEKVYKNKL